MRKISKSTEAVLKKKKIPTRMCIACREKKPKKELIRIVVFEAGLIADETGKAQGRGAYICPSVECLDKAKKIRAFDRMLETPMSEESYNAIKRVILRRDIQ